MPTLDTPTILLIEDSAEDAELMVDALARVLPQGQVGVCTDGADALDFFHCRGAHASRNPAELPTFVLLDLELPRIGGLDVLRGIRTDPAARLVPVTIMSASARGEDVRTAAELGANSYVRKPTDGRELKETLSRIALYWLQLNVPPPISARQ